MGTYLTDSGFIKPTWQEFLIKTKQRMSSIWGAAFDTGDTTPAGQLAGIIAKSLADSADADQEVYASLDPLQATGEALSRIAALRGTWRQSSAPSQARVTCYAEAPDEGLVISTSDKVRRVRGAVPFTARTATAIVRSVCSDVYLSAENDFAEGDTISATFSFGTFSTVVTSAGTLAALQSIAGKIALGFPTGMATAYDSTTDAGFAYKSRAVRVWTVGGDFQFVSCTGVSLEVLGTPVWFDCDTDGPTVALAGEISAIETPETGWLSCYNLQSAILGRNDETDDELRIRMYLRDGKATEDAIRKKILNDVAGVSGCSVRSNRTMADDEDGRQPKSFEVTVTGGADQEIADAIWDTAPAGIEIYANLSEGGIQCSVVDGEGRTQTVKFSRPIAKVLFAKITLSRYTEEAIPTSGISAIRTAILSWATKEFTAGQDVIPSRFYVPIYSVPGIGLAVIQVAVTNSVTDTPVYTTDEIAVGSRVHVVLAEETLNVEFAS